MTQRASDDWSAVVFVLLVVVLFLGSLYVGLKLFGQHDDPVSYPPPPRVTVKCAQDAVKYLRGADPNTVFMCGGVTFTNTPSGK